MLFYRLRLALVTQVVCCFFLTVRGEILVSGSLQWDGHAARYLDGPAPLYAEGNLARRPGAKAIALDVGPGSTEHTVDSLNDGNYGDGHSWIGNSADSWAGLDLGVRTRLTGFAFSRDNTAGGLTDRTSGTYRIQYTQSAQVGVGSSWTDLGTISLSGSDQTLSRRHQFTLSSAIEATGFRIITPLGASIDEMELYDTTPAGLVSPWLTAGRFGLGLATAIGAPHWGEARLDAVYQQRPLTVEAWVKLNSKMDSNIIVAAGFQQFSGGWLLASDAGSGNLMADLPGSSPTTVESGHCIADGDWHYVAMALEQARVRLYVDGAQVADKALSPSSLPAAGLSPADQPGGLYVGAYPPHHQGCDGMVDELRISHGILNIRGVPWTAFKASGSTVGLWHFNRFIDGGFSDSSARTNPVMLAPPPANPVLQLQRGITLDRLYFGIQSHPMFTLADVNMIKSMGFDHIKVLIDPATHKSGAGIDPATMPTLKMNVDLALSSGLPVVVDIHPQAEFKHAEVGDPVEFENYLGFMNSFARWMATNYSPHQIAFEFMTEPFGDYTDWTLIQYRLWASVRAAMPGHTLILSGDETGRLAGVLGLHPVNDSNVLYCFSSYEPFAFTLQGADWAEFAGSPNQYLKNVPYPSSPEIIQAALPELLANAPGSIQPAMRQSLLNYGEQSWSPEVLTARFKRLRDWNSFFGGHLQLWCGEFGCLGPNKGGVRPTDRQAFLSDVRRALETNGIWWDYWSYNETFNVLLPDRIPMAPAPSAHWIDPALLDALGTAETTVSLSGTDWKIHEDPAGRGADQKFFDADPAKPGWLPAQVPGNVQADVEAAHLVEPLWYGGVNTNLYEAARKDWWYRKDFIVPASFAGRRITLDFDGVDEHCQVWLNGTLIGENGGMFRRFWFDVSGVAVAGRTNRLAVQIQRMPDELLATITNSDGPYNGPAGGLMDRARQALNNLKTPGDLGFDWSANVWTLGIWKPVRLEATGPARIDWTRVETTLSSNYTQASVQATLEVDSLSSLPVQAEFCVTGHGQRAAQRVDAVLQKGSNFVTAELMLAHPALWWPNGQGDQSLYTLDVQLQPADGGPMADKSSTRFGVRELRWGFTQAPAASSSNDVLNFNGRPPECPLRQLRWLPHDDTPANFTNSYQLFVNGRAVRTIGSAPILPYLLPGCGSAHELPLLRFARDAGMNFLRLNGGGGGPLFDDAWYDRADELGIMISYEYPAACAVLGSDPIFLTNLEAACRSMIQQTRNHPSIVEYVGGSEMGYLDKDWNALVQTPAVAMMRKIAAEENDRLFRITDPELGSKHGPWAFDLLHSNFSYGYWNGSGSDTMRYSEFGTASPANLEVWHREIPLPSQWPLTNVNDPILIYHNAAKSAFTDMDWLFQPWISAAFGNLDNLPDFVAGGQYYGAEGLRYIFDALRRKGRRIGGMTNHTFSEPWPNAAGSYMIDYDGRPLMNYDFLKQALAPISLSLQFDSCLYTPAAGIQAELFLISDAPAAASGLRSKWVARDREGTVFDHGETTASIEPLEVKSLGAIKLRPPEKTMEGPVLLELRLEDATGRLLVERVQIFGRADLPAPLAGLLNKASAHPVVRTALQVSAAPARTEGDEEVLDLQVKNTGLMTALFCEPHPLIVYRTDLFIDNNHCFIPPGESRQITIRAPHRPECGLSLAQTGWTVSTWNADDVTVDPSPEVLLSVGRWDKMCREFAGYFDVHQAAREATTVCTGGRPEAGKLPYRLSGRSAAQFKFACTNVQANDRVRLRIHTSDQADSEPTVVQITINGRMMEKVLPPGLGIQRSDPAHRAYPVTLEFDLGGSDLREGGEANKLTVRVVGHGWFSWDALDLVRKS